MTDSGLAKAEHSPSCHYESKLGGPLCGSSVQLILNIVNVRVKVIITYELLLFNKFGRITTLELRRWATTGGNLDR